MNAAILLENLADAGTVTASAEVDGMPASLLLTSPHVTDDLWRADSATASLTLDLGADVELDTVALLGITGSAGKTIRLRISTEAGGATSGDVTDTGALADGATQFAQAYGSFVHLEAAPVTARYVRFDIEDTGAGRVEAGRLVVGLREALDYNFAPGSQFDWVDPSPVARSRGGQSLVWERARYRVAVLTIGWVTDDQRWGLFERLGRDTGRHADVLLCLDPAAANLPQWTIWGLVSEAGLAAWSEIADLHTKTVKIEERL